MLKKGQVTTFVIIGIVILILAMLVFYLSSSGKAVLPSIFLSFSGKKDLVESNLHDCVEKVVRPAVQLAALQGGDINNAPNYRLYKGNKVAYSCVVIPGTNRCLNIMKSLSTLESNLRDNIQKQIDNCVDRSLLDGLETKGSKNVKVDLDIARESVIVNINYDVTIVNKNIDFPIGEVKVLVSDLPFGELYSVAHDVVNSQALAGDFEQLFYMLANKGRYEIQVDRPYPDKIFSINKKDSKFIYRVAIQGEDTVKYL